MPLALCSMGQEVTVKKVGGSAAVKQHLNELGFNVGSPISVVSALGGNIIVSVKNSRIAIDRTMAAKIIV